MANIEIMRPNRSEWTTCLVAEPHACKGIAYLEKKATEIEIGADSYRGRLNEVRQVVDEVAGRCPAFNHFHRKHGRKLKLEQLPCQKLRRHIEVERLGGQWTEHDYTVPAGRQYLP